MQFLSFVITIILVAVFIAQPIITFVHEMGHAMAGIILTKQNVTVYIGSYGEEKGSIRIKIRLLECYIKPNPFLWYKGISILYSEDVSVNRRILYTLAGPFASFFLGVVCCYIAFAFDLHGAFKYFIIIFICTALVDLMRNLIPDSRGIQLSNGSYTYNDGYFIKMYFYFKKMSHHHLKAFELYNNHEYGLASDVFDKFINNKLNPSDMLRNAIYANMMCSRYTRALEINRLLIEKFIPDSGDYSRSALIRTYLGLYDEALDDYNKSINLDPTNKNALNNRGYNYNLMGDYEKGITDFDEALRLDPVFFFSYNNRGIAKIKLGMTEEGLKDINYSLELEPNNAYAYMNLGIYHYDKGENAEALKLFIKAKEMNAETFEIDSWIKKAEG